jgi:hypothetical protein
MKANKNLVNFVKAAVIIAIALTLILPGVAGKNLEISSQKNVSPSAGGALKYVSTTGCYGPIFSWITDIRILDGPSDLTEALDYLLHSPQIRMVGIHVEVYDLDLEIEYKRTIPQTAFLLMSRCLYMSLIGEIIDGQLNVTEGIFAEKHTITIHGLYGNLDISRARLFRVMPARFGFYGWCEDVSITT